ncbi:MAG: endonuclease domain-containing protein [Candidatus Jettenia sp.]|nr:MAG: endonuclease domain-containing protein [Candidatus Jettenia sp.]
MRIYYNSKLKTLSRELRKKGTLSEVLLWNILKGKRIKGYQFMRQKPIGDYIVDFFCNKLKLVIEIDGISHNEKSASDQIRQQKLESLGLSVLRFYEWDVKKDIHAVVQVIENWIEEFERKDTTTKNTTP